MILVVRAILIHHFPSASSWSTRTPGILHPHASSWLLASTRSSSSSHHASAHAWSRAHAAYASTQSLPSGSRSHVLAASSWFHRTEVGGLPRYIEILLTDVPWVKALVHLHLPLANAHLITELGVGAATVARGVVLAAVDGTWSCGLRNLDGFTHVEDVLFLVDFALELFSCCLDGVVGSHAELVKVFEFAVGAQGQAKHVYQDLLVGFFYAESLTLNSKTHQP